MRTFGQLPKSGEAVEYPTTTYGVLRRAASEYPDGIYFIDGDDRLTYSEMLERADYFAEHLAGLDVRPGDRVVIWLPNGATWAALFYACGRLGAVAVMAGTRLRGVDVRHIVSDSEASLLIYTPKAFGIDFERMVAAIDIDRRKAPSPHPKHIVVVGGKGGFNLIELESVQPVTADREFDDAAAPATVCYTSGTTGSPKGCVQSHGALLRNGAVGAELTGLRQGDRIVCPVPFAHVFGFHMAVLQAALVGAAVVNAEPFNASRLLEITESTKGTVLYMVPAMARDVLDAQRQNPSEISSVRLAVLAGASVSVPLRTEFADPFGGLGVTLSVVYGCSEAPTISQTAASDPLLKQLESVGRPTPGVEVLLVDPGTTAPVATGEIGEILVRGYNVMIGYLNDPKGTKAKFRKGWLVTDDLGFLDEDGYLQIAGRASEMFTVGGFNVYPREVESQLELHPTITEAAVVGVPDARLGAVPMAWVRVSDNALVEDEILAWAKRNLASYKRPRHARIVRTLPRTSTGKISRVQIEGLTRRALPHLDWEEDL